MRSLHCLSIFDVLVVGHGHRSDTRIILRIRFSEDCALLVAHSEPTQRFVLASLALHPQRRFVGLFL